MCCFQKAVRKVRAGHLTDGRHAPCIFPVPPSFPQGGIPDHPPLKIRCAGVAPGHSSSPALSRRLHFPFSALRQWRRRPFPLPNGPAPPLLFLARRFIPADNPHRHPRRGKGHASPCRVCHVPCCGRQMARRSSGLSCRLQSGHRPRRRGRHGPCIFGRRPASPPARHFICTFPCFRFRLPMAAGDEPCPPVCYAAPQVKESARMSAALQSPESRRGVAPHRLCAPQPPLYSPAHPRGCNRLRRRASRRPDWRFTPAPVRPAGAPFTPPGRA